MPVEIREYHLGVFSPGKRCAKCGYDSGNNWAQCKQACPMENSPHYKPNALAVHTLQGFLARLFALVKWRPDERTSSLLRHVLQVYEGAFYREYTPAAIWESAVDQQIIALENERAEDWP